MDSRYSIVVDSTPWIRRQAVAWTRCALTLAGIAPDRLHVNVMSSVPNIFTAGMARWGVKCRRLREGFSAGPLNKSRQLEPGVIPRAPLTILCDCDTVFTAALPEFASSSSGLRGKLVDIGNPPFYYWRTLFLLLGLRMTDDAVRVARNGHHTYRNNLNGGLYIIREDVRDEVFRVWRASIRTLLANPGYVRPWRYHTDQIAFGLACARLGLSVDLVDDRLNYPLHLRPVGHLSELPVVLHHHQKLAGGILRYGTHGDAEAHGPARQAIEQVNSVLRTVVWSRFGL